MNKKSRFVWLVLLIASLLYPSAVLLAEDQPCLHAAIEAAYEIEDKSVLVFAEGLYWPTSQHVQLRIWNGKGFKVLSGAVNEKWMFRPTRFYTWNEYCWMHKKDFEAFNLKLEGIK